MLRGPKPSNLWLWITVNTKPCRRYFSSACPSSGVFGSLLHSSEFLMPLKPLSDKNAVP